MCRVECLRNRPECQIFCWTQGGGDEWQHALGLSGLVAPLLHLPDAVQHGSDKVGAEEQAHNGEALPLGIQRTLGVSLERDAAWSVLCHCIVAAQHQHQMASVQVRAMQVGRTAGAGKPVIAVRLFFRVLVSVLTRCSYILFFSQLCPCLTGSWCGDFARPSRGSLRWCRYL